MIALWTSRSDNSKTGDMPQAFIGSTRAESLASCAGCPLLENRKCYAQFGTPAMGHSSLMRAADRGQDRGLVRALDGRSPSARAVRVGSVGEPGVMSEAWHANVRVEADVRLLAVLSYTHRWRERPDLKTHAMASCDTLSQVDAAVDAGWRAAVVLPAEQTEDTFTPAGRRVVICPAIRHKGRVTCNDCRLCDARRSGPVVGFPEH